MDIKCILFSSITDVNILQTFLLVSMKDEYDKHMKINQQMVLIFTYTQKSVNQRFSTSLKKKEEIIYNTISDNTDIDK